MIQPEEIVRKARKLYEEKVFPAWLAGDELFFPQVIPSNKTLPGDVIAAAEESIRRLREGSKEVRGFGYTVEWKQRTSRKFGQNRFPTRILFETRDDLLRLIGRCTEFAEFCRTVTDIRVAHPELESWVGSHIKELGELQPLEVEGLIEVVRYFQAHPRPNRFARELPLSVDTKFIELHQGVLTQWFDILLPPHTIRSDESHFERRYGLRYPQTHLLVRFLDRDVQQQLGFPCDELSLPLGRLSDLPAQSLQAFIVENKVNLLTLPMRTRGIVLGGLGRGVTELRHVAWLHDSKIWYWGDLDVEGFQILSSLRKLFPQTSSFLMDRQTIDRWRHLAGDGTGSQPDLPSHLTPKEKSAFDLCCAENLRLEQERIPQAAVQATLEDLETRMDSD